VQVQAFVNAALKVRDVAEASRWFERIGAQVGPIETWRGSRRVDVHVGGILVTLFERAIYEDQVALGEESFLHLVFAVDDLDAALEGQQVVWGPEVVEGSFGRRRIAFVEAPGNVRVEFMVELDPKPS
jgi:catechol 2,3-dioxygenase-like lactoylglutathione lyase family enzyme